MRTIISAAVATIAIATGPALAQDGDMAFGTEDDIAYAELLWDRLCRVALGSPMPSCSGIAYAEFLWDLMEAERLAGPNMIRAFPYMGSEPHGMMLETFYDVGTIGDHTGDLIVKRNFGPEGVSVDEVLSNPDGHLGAYTVMFRREAGYDPENLDWFWARYNPDGSIAENPMGMALAGRVARGTDEGCIACHQGAADDMVFTSDRLIAN